MRSVGAQIAAIVAAILISIAASAKDITVADGKSINDAIAAPSTQAGDRILVPAGAYWGGLVITKPVTIEATGDVRIRPTTPGKGPAVSIRSSDCAVQGITFEDFGGAASPDKNTGRDNVTLKNLKFRDGTGGLWISGNHWTVDGVEIDGLHLSKDAEDYANVFGNDHVIRRCYFHGVRIPQDLGAGPDYKHNDCLQFWNNNGEELHNLLVEECIFTDFVQGLFLANETGKAGSVSNITIRNNVFWGTDFVKSGNLLGNPSHGVFIGKASIDGVTITNNLFRKVGNCVSLYAMKEAVVEGNIIASGGTAYAVGDGTEPRAFHRGTKGNVLWNNGWNGYPEQGPDKHADPLVASATKLVGRDGIPFTADDGWRCTAKGLDGYGPQIASP